MDVKEFVKKNLLTILSVVAIICMVLPFMSFEAQTQYSETSETFNGFQLCSYSMYTYMLILLPATLIVMNYISQLKKYKGILTMLIPAICLISLLIVYFTAKAGYEAGAGAGAEMASAFGVEMDYASKIGIGMILSGICYVGMIIYGFKTQRDFSIEKININMAKPDVEGIKNAGAEFFKNAQATVSKAAQNISENISSASVGTTSKKHVDDTLALIERLAKMKDDGILTEEEFKEKKAKLLEEI